MSGNCRCAFSANRNGTVHVKTNPKARAAVIAELMGRLKTVGAAAP
jgi:spore germination cell wall hydrolase CwlJ-like protein